MDPSVALLVMSGKYFSTTLY